MNLPQRADVISPYSPPLITWLYDALGNKLRKTTLSYTVAHVTDYFDGIEYLDNSLISIYHPEGRVTPNLSNNYVYEYAVKDHLNNTRVTFYDKNKNFSLDLSDLNEYHYYPFGLFMEGNNTLLGNWNGYNGGLSLSSYGYSRFYNGKEWNKDNGLNWYDYGKRWYDPAIGRFPSVDPIIDKFAYLTPYNYASNDPVKNIDLWGLQGYAATWNYARDQLKQRGVSEKTLGVSDQMIAEGAKASLKLGLDLAAGELIPGYDEAQSAREGDYMGVFMGTIPLLGSVRKIAKALDNVADAGKALDKASDLTNAGHEVEKLSEVAQGTMDAAKGRMTELSTLSPTHYVTKSESTMKRFVSDVKSDGAINENILYVEHNGSKFIVDGHHRFFAAQKLGIQHVPVQQVQLPFRGYQTTSDLILSGKQPGWWKFYKP